MWRSLLYLQLHQWAEWARLSSQLLRCWGYEDSKDINDAKVVNLSLQDHGIILIWRSSTFDLITLLTSKLYGQTIPLADYVYNAGTEPNMYAYGQINPNTDPASEAFDSLMYSILSANNFLSKEVKFDDAFWAFVNPSDPTKDHPDKYSTRAYLVNNG